MLSSHWIHSNPLFLGVVPPGVPDTAPDPTDVVATFGSDGEGNFVRLDWQYPIDAAAAGIAFLTRHGEYDPNGQIEEWAETPDPPQHSGTYYRRWNLESVSNLDKWHLGHTLVFLVQAVEGGGGG